MLEKLGPTLSQTRIDDEKTPSKPTQNVLRVIIKLGRNQLKQTKIFYKILQVRFYSYSFYDQSAC